MVLVLVLLGLLFYCFNMSEAMAMRRTGMGIVCAEGRGVNNLNKYNSRADIMILPPYTAVWIVTISEFEVIFLFFKSGIWE